MDVLYSIIFGIVEGLTEFLPVSSTGHLMLTAKILGFEQTDFIKSFEIIIQFGAITSVIVLYWKYFFVKFEVLKRVMVAFIPTAIIGLIFYKIIKEFLLSSQVVVLWALLIGGVVLIIFELLYKGKNVKSTEISKMSYKNSILIGIFQSIAMIPGVSRSAATILGGLSLGMDRKAIVEFSFLLAVPTMLAATGLDLVKNVHTFSLDQIQFLVIGFVTSFIVAILSIKFFLNYIKRHTFISFGFYRVILVVVFWFFYF